MNDPLAPDNYRFEGREDLEACIAKLREHAEELNQLSFGDSAMDIMRTLNQIEHHIQVDGWTKISRAVLNYLSHQIRELKLPRVSVRHPFREEGNTSLEVSLSIPLMDGVSVADFVRRWDPGHPFDRECNVCGADPKKPCGGTVDMEIGCHPERRFDR